MAKRNSGGGEIILVALVALAWGISSLFGFVATNLVEIIIATTIIVAFWLWLKARRRKKNLIAFEAYKRSLLEKYKHSEVVERILNSEYWTGQTTDQLEDSLGAPSDIDTTVLKTKTKEVWKYGKVRKGQYRLRINIENGKVVGWSDKSN